MHERQYLFSISKIEFRLKMIFRVNVQYVNVGDDMHLHDTLFKLPHKIA